MKPLKVYVEGGDIAFQGVIERPFSEMAGYVRITKWECDKESREENYMDDYRIGDDIYVNLNQCSIERRVSRKAV